MARLSSTAGLERKEKMKTLRAFYNEQFGQLRTHMDDDGNLWFVASDVCAALDITNNRDAIGNLDDDEKGVGISDTPGGRQKMAIITEPGLYSLVLRSRKPEAKLFKRWITHEVIPAIRKTGQYQQTAVQAVAIIRRPCDNQNLLSYVSTLRQMARLKVYPPLMRAAFLAEAASLLSSYPVSRFMPPSAPCHLFH